MAQNETTLEKEAAEACNFMASQVFAPAFFEKLSSHGIAPRNEAEALQLVELGVTLGALEAEGQYKSAAQVSNETANPFLAQLIGGLRPATYSVEASLKQAASKLAADPAIAQAAQRYSRVVNKA